MMREYIEHHQAILHPAPRRNLVTENNLFAIVVCASIEEETACTSSGSFAAHQCVRGSSTTAWLKDCPTSKAPRDFLNVFLRVAAIDTKRVQLHQLTRIVFI